MAKIRAKDTKPELFIRSALYALNFRYRVNYGEIPGHPDLYFTKKKVAIFIHGCYWHRHPNCKLAYTPKSNSEFWHMKFQANQERDKTIIEALVQKGIRVLIIWECSIRKMMIDPAAYQSALTKIEHFILTGDESLAEI